ncbi:MAG: hypothetical protein KA177_06280 [Paludibacter sp.]|nr:hypothetical protein [Paludibacter sp.]
MKKSIIFLLALLTLCACDTDDPEGPEGKEVKYYSTTPEHFSYQVGFTDAASANLYETNEYAVISQSSVWEYSWAFIPSVVKKPDIRRLVYSYQTQEYYQIFDTKHYYTVTHSFYAYYSAIVEWDTYQEFRTQNDITDGREVRENLKCTIKYLGCTNGTPVAYYPVDTSIEVVEYPDYKGEWIFISNDSGSGGSTSGDDDVSTRDYSYHSSTVCYKKSTGESDDLYIYRKNNDYRASWVYDSKGLDKGATMTIHTGYAEIGGNKYSYYVSNFGIPWYFNYSK